MILWSSRKLEHALADDQLSPWAKVKYLILPAVVASLWGPFYVIRPRYGAPEPAAGNLVKILCSLLAAYLTYWGIKRCFRANQQSGGEAFFERFAVLGVPVVIRIIAVVVPLCIAVGLGAVAIRERMPYLSDPPAMFADLLGPVIAYVTFAMLRNSFERLGRLTKREAPESS